MNPRLIDNGPGDKTEHDRRHRQRWTDFDILGLAVIILTNFGKSVLGVGITF